MNRAVSRIHHSAGIDTAVQSGGVECVVSPRLYVPTVLGVLVTYAEVHTPHCAYWPARPLFLIDRGRTPHLKIKIGQRISNASLIEQALPRVLYVVAGTPCIFTAIEIISCALIVSQTRNEKDELHRVVKARGCNTAMSHPMNMSRGSCGMRVGNKDKVFDPAVVLSVTWGRHR